MASNQITLGRKIVDGKTADPLNIDVMRMLVSRVLITSSSGGGKSWLLRLMLERLSKIFPMIVFDPEGEFASLREIVDLVLVGADGEVPADPATAGLLCRHLVENRVSAVIDLSELTPTRRREYIANFLNAMLDLPKRLWTPYVVAIDEIHEYAPNSKIKDECKEAIDLLFSKGRKRGFCGIAATQRLANASPNVTAECKTRIIGQISYDVDLERAARFLGWGSEGWPRLRDLSPPGHEGQFFCVGPAMVDRGVVLFRSDKVRTHHPKPGEGSTYVPPQPSAKLAGVLVELKALPAKLEEEKVTIESLTRRNAELETSVRDLNKIVTSRAKPSAPTPAVSPTASAEISAVKRKLAQAKQLLETAMGLVKKQASALSQPVAINVDKVREIVDTAVGSIVKMAQSANASRQADLKKLQTEAEKLAESAARLLLDDATPPASASGAWASSPVSPDLKSSWVDAAFTDGNNKPADSDDETENDEIAEGADASLGKGGRKVLTAIVQFGQIKKSQLFTLTGYKSTSLKNALSLLRQRGYVIGSGDGPYAPTAGGTKAAGNYKPLPTGKALAEYWLKRLGTGEKRALELLLSVYPNWLTPAQLEEKLGYASTSRKNIVTAMNARQLIEKSREKGIRASAALFD